MIEASVRVENENLLIIVNFSNILKMKVYLNYKRPYFNKIQIISILIFVKQLIKKFEIVTSNHHFKIRFRLIYNEILWRKKNLY